MCVLNCGKPRDGAGPFKVAPRKDWYYHSPFTNKETEAQDSSANKGQTKGSNLGSLVPEATVLDTSHLKEEEASPEWGILTPAGELHLGGKSWKRRKESHSHQ